MKELFSTISNNMYVQFLYGTAGIYIFAFISSIIHEKLLSHSYLSVSLNTNEKFTYPVALVMFPYLSGWLIGSLVKFFTKQETAAIPKKNLMFCAGAVFTATLTYNIAIIQTSYPVVIMVKSCSILSVIIVGVFCSRVRDQHNKLGKNKLVVGALVTLGIFLFNYFAVNKSGDKATTLLGVILLLISLVADGFLPDFQAQIKTVYKPKPIDLMSQINKWIFFLCVIYTILRMELLPILLYMVDHPQFSLDMLYMSVMSTVVQMFVYYLIQKFRQHIVPFIITIRKIFSVVISIIWFSHPINTTQIVGIFVVFVAAIFDFIYQKYFAVATSSGHHGLQHLPSKDQKSMIEMQDTYSLKTESEIHAVENSLDLQVDIKEEISKDDKRNIEAGSSK